MESHEHNEDGIEFTHHQIEAQPGPNGSILYDVPTNILPPSQRRVYARAMPNDPGRVLDVTLLMDRGTVTRLGEFLARHGAIDREPTDAEMTVVMQTLGDAMATAQVELMSLASQVLVQRLGNGDGDSAAATVAESMARAHAAKKAKAEGLTKAEAEEQAEEIKQSLIDWARRMAARHEGEEGGAA